MKEQTPPLFERYLRLMDSSVDSKFEQIVPHLPIQLKESGKVLIGIGAGTGKLERSIKQALPNATVVALDYSMPMIEEITGHNSNNHQKTSEIIPLMADASKIPLKSDSVTAIIASSVVHEIASFGDNYSLGPTTTNFYQESARVLAPGGRLIIRDFMKPPQPKQEIILKIGSKQKTSDTNPVQFIYDYLREFKGDDLEYLKNQMDKPLKTGSTLRIKSAHALELVTHYSWSRRFDDEVQEKYAYLSTNKYAHHVHKAISEKGISTSIIATHGHFQSGYPEHIGGRLDLQNLDGTKYPFSPITGIIVIEKN